jgi:hypothetical protein
LIGSWINNQRGAQALRWLKQGMAVFGEVGRAQFSVPDSKGIRFKLDAPSQAPFKNVAGSLVLERRENLPLWGFEWLRGKRDTLLLTADLRHSPPGDLRAFHASNLSQVEAAREGKSANLTFLCQEGEMHLYARGEAAPELVQRVTQIIRSHPGLFLELTLQRKSPQILMHGRLSKFLASSPEPLFQSIERALN